MYPLTGINIGAADYVPGPLEDWIPGALNFGARPEGPGPAKNQYAVLANAEMMKPFSFRESKKSRHEGGKPEPCIVECEALKNPQIYNSNLLIELNFKTIPGHTGGGLFAYMQRNGHRV